MIGAKEEMKRFEMPKANDDSQEQDVDSKVNREVELVQSTNGNISDVLQGEVPAQMKPAFVIEGGNAIGHDRMDGEPLLRLSLSKISGIVVYWSLFMFIMILPNIEGGHQMKSREIIEYVVIALMTIRLLAVPLRFRPPFSFSVGSFKDKKESNSIEERQSIINPNTEVIEIQTPSSSNHKKIEGSNDTKKIKPRLFYLANIKSFVILCVVAVHSASLFGGFFLGAYRNSFSTTMSILIFLIYPMAMPACFFLSAFFMAPSFQEKGRRQFLNQRTLRLAPVFFWLFCVANPSFNYVISKTLLPPPYRPYVMFEPTIASAWFVGLLLCFAFVFVTVFEAWCPNEEINNDSETSRNHEVDGETSEGEETSRSMEESRNAIPMIKYFLVSAVVGGMEGIRRVYAPYFTMSGTGNIGFFILQMISGCIAQKQGWLSTPQNHGILTKKQLTTSILIILSVMLIVALVLLRDVLDPDGADTIIPFKNICGDSEVVEGHANPTNRLDEVKKDPVAIIISVILYLCLGLYMVSSVLGILDLFKRKFDYTNRLLSMMDRCSYGIYAVHLLFVMVLFPAYIEILRSAGVIENEFVFDAQVLSPSCLGDNDLFIWLGFLFVLVFSYVGSLLLVLCLLKLPGVKYIL